MNPPYGHSGPFPDRAEHRWMPGSNPGKESFMAVPGDGQGGTEPECGE